MLTSAPWETALTDMAAPQIITVGVTEHGNSAELVTLCGADLLDRRRIDLTRNLPTHPHHHEGSWAVGRYRDSPWAREISLPDAIKLVHKVRKAAARGATGALQQLAAAVPQPVCAIAIRLCPELPASVEDCIADNRAQTVADSVMYRRALAAAAEARGWQVYWYERDRVYEEAAAALGDAELQPALRAMGRVCGPPWRAAHKLAAAAALAASVEIQRR